MQVFCTHDNSSSGNKTGPAATVGSHHRSFGRRGKCLIYGPMNNVVTVVVLYWFALISYFRRRLFAAQFIYNITTQKCKAVYVQDVVSKYAKVICELSRKFTACVRPLSVLLGRRDAVDRTDGRTTQG